MPNDSSTGGYLAPAATLAPLEEDALDDFLGDIVAAVTGLDRDNYVRPRWQGEPPNLPARSTDWVAIGVVHRPAPVGSAVVTYNPEGGTDGDGAIVLLRQEELELLCSFYGPNCQGNGTMLRDGLYIAQNREAMAVQSLKIADVSDLTKAPEMIKTAWYPRADLTVKFRREVRREYPVLTILSMTGTLDTEAALEAIAAAAPGQLDFRDPANSGQQPQL